MLLETEFWRVAGRETQLLAAMHLLFPPLAALVLWKQNGAAHFKLRISYSLGGWFT